MEDRVSILVNKDTDNSDDMEGDNVPFRKLEYIYAYLMLAVGFCFIRFVFWNVTGIFTTLFFGVTAIACFIYIKKNNFILHKNHILQFGLIIIFGTVFSVTANNFIKFLNIIFLLMSGMYWIYSICIENKKIERFFFFDMWKALIIMPFASFSKELKAITCSTGQSKLGNNIKLILIGLVVTMPLTLMVAMLLTSADRGVEEILNLLYSSFIENSLIMIVQFAFGIPVACYIFGMLYSNVNKKSKEILTNEQCENKLERIKIIPNLVMYSAVMPVCILYVIFFVSQLRYFISAFNGVLPEVYSYAEYARRGFFELFVISIINLMILLLMNFLSKQTGDNKTTLLKTYTVLLSVFTILIISSALSKMVMYISNYGLTPLRVYTSWFMVLLTIIFVIIIVKQFVSELCLAKYIIVTFVILFGFLSFSNVDGNIAKFNIRMYQSGNLNELDVEALCNLSDDALVYVLKQEIDTKEYLIGKIEYYNHNPYDTYNLSSFRVKMMLEDMK